MKKRVIFLQLALVTGIAAFAMPGVPSTPVNEIHPLEALAPETDLNEMGMHHRVPRRQDDYYDRRRRYWEDRLERDLDDEEYGDDEDADDPAYANEQTKETSKAKETKKAAPATDDEFSEDEAERELEHRREYWRRRLDRDW